MSFHKQNSLFCTWTIMTLHFVPLSNACSFLSVLLIQTCQIASSLFFTWFYCLQCAFWVLNFPCLLSSIYIYLQNFTCLFCLLVAVSTIYFVLVKKTVLKGCFFFWHCHYFNCLHFLTKSIVLKSND